MLSERSFDLLLIFILVLAAATIAVGAIYNFRLVAFTRIYDYRDMMDSPKALNYLVTIVSGALLPFAFAGFVAREAYWRAGAALFLLLLFYPITLSKAALFTPAWLVAIMLLSKIFEARMTVILSLLAPLVVGLILLALRQGHALPDEAVISYFGITNFRMLAIPSIALDFYNNFFSTHELTYFCQIRALKPLISCPYHELLSSVILEAYGMGGNFNASLFATEGIASVGMVFAPLAVFVCGLILSLGNRLSAGLPPRFVLISGAILPQILLNVPLTITLLTHGAVFLFLLWYVTPRTMFEPQESAQIAPAHR